MTTTPPGLTALAFNLDVTTRFPLDLFADIAATNNGTDEVWQTYMDVGLTLSLGPLRVIVPLWAKLGDEEAGTAFEDWRIGISIPNPLADF